MTSSQISEATLIEYMKGLDESQLKKMVEKVKEQKQKEENPDYDKLKSEFDELTAYDYKTINRILTKIYKIANEPNPIQINYIKYIQSQYKLLVDGLKKQQQQNNRDQMNSNNISQPYIRLCEYSFRYLCGILENYCVIETMTKLALSHATKFQTQSAEAVEFFVRSTNLTNKKGFQLSHALDNIFDC